MSDIKHIKLIWDDNSSDELGFVLERKKGTDDYETLATLDAGVTTYIDRNVFLDETYYYRVKAYNAAGDSAYSNVVSTV